MEGFDEKLTRALLDYHTYVDEIISQVKDFDIWYMIQYESSFPKEWYTLIKNHNKN